MKKNIFTSYPLARSIGIFRKMKKKVKIACSGMEFALPRSSAFAEATSDKLAAGGYSIDSASTFSYRVSIKWVCSR